jgi:microcystin degradation protein MlrC
VRLFAASLATESNSFSPIPTNRRSYEDTLHFPPGAHPDRPSHCTAPLWVARRRARRKGSS